MDEELLERPRSGVLGGGYKIFVNVLQATPVSLGRDFTSRCHVPYRRAVMLSIESQHQQLSIHHALANRSSEQILKPVSSAHSDALSNPHALTPQSSQPMSSKTSSAHRESGICGRWRRARRL
jgi:hypothetical protein